MVRDQIFYLLGGEVHELKIPDEFRDSYNSVVMFMKANDYNVPKEILEKAYGDSTSNQ